MSRVNTQQKVPASRADLEAACLAIDPRFSVAHEARDQARVSIVCRFHVEGRPAAISRCVAFGSELATTRELLVDALAILRRPGVAVSDG